MLPIPSAAMKQLAAFTLVVIAGAAQAQMHDPIGDQIRYESGAYTHEQNGGNPATIHNQNSSSAAKTHYINSGGSKDVYNDIHVPESYPQASPYPKPSSPLVAKGSRHIPINGLVAIAHT